MFLGWCENTILGELSAQFWVAGGSGLTPTYLFKDLYKDIIIGSLKEGRFYY